MIPPRPVSILLGENCRNYTQTEQGDYVSTYSQLFRADAQLPRVLKAWSDSNDETTDALSITSIACSLGAEPASMLAHVKNSNFLGKVSLTGVDIDPRVLVCAEQGQYQLDPGSYLPQDTAEIVAELRTYGLDVSHNPESEEPPTVNARPLFDKYEAQFVEIDVIATPPPPGNIMLCNNLLYHLSLDSADKILQNAAKSLETGDIISLGTNNSLSRESWQQIVCDKLDLGLTPILYNKDVPFAFQKTS
ncbi:MAG TPA: CheR family methyltransferase [Candidatus Limnocylindria bacterium]|nr:CheR family methyltransferase [Candidatus Limnocylindria bacterium]